LQRVGGLRNEHRRRHPLESIDVASATDRPGKPRRVLAAI
jgi:hypothetical protein